MMAGNFAISLAIIGLMTSLLVSAPAFAGPNENTALILHAVPGFGTTCGIADPCSTGAQVQVQVQKPGEWTTIYVVLRNYDNVRDVIFEATWDPGFEVFFGTDCFPGCYDCLWIDQFNHRLTWYAGVGCQVGGQSVVLGRLYAWPTAGCFTLVQGDYPEVTSCQGETDRIQVKNLGRVCVGPGGIDTCNGPVAVESETWGAIKAQYQMTLPR